MIDAYRVIDGFCPQTDRVRASALAAGFGRWSPNTGYVGSSKYDGMGFWGDHSPMLASLAFAMQSHVFPNSMFFRVTHPDTERAYIHSDREAGAYTCIVYLSEHAERYGTAFWRHIATGLRAMPAFSEIATSDHGEQLKRDMVSASESAWEQLDFVRGDYGRALIFKAPLFHSRVPNDGFGTNPETGRLIWACHFHTPKTLMQKENDHG